MKALFITTQLVKKRPWVIHIFYFCCRIKSIKNSFKSFGMIRPNTLLTACIKKVF